MIDPIAIQVTNERIRDTRRNAECPLILQQHPSSVSIINVQKQVIGSCPEPDRFI